MNIDELSESEIRAILRKAHVLSPNANVYGSIVELMIGGVSVSREVGTRITVEGVK